ncbi:hypothetical protein F7725_006354 [Dissostichus mawsoni]|uniref:ZP domain-containing protein n=1 Tax=Dissostichus mawsoni TaxID=36200 RepID=A0A7J5XTS3_DISMA|nr:hypothetical protein F7725_006354 [Dissostichus mawsoni]
MYKDNEGNTEGWKRRNSIKRDGARHSATSELHLQDQDQDQDQDFKRTISCPREPSAAPDSRRPVRKPPTPGYPLVCLISAVSNDMVLFLQTPGYPLSTDHPPTFPLNSCNLMRQPPFSACHNHTDPEPFISACTHTLCRYPPPPLCQQPCSDHEFCGAEMWSSSRCLCRAGFASKYRATKSLGDPTVCRQDSASVVLAGCLLDDKGIDFSTLHLKDPSCKGHMDPQSHLVTFSFNRSAPCGTEVMLCGAAACIWSVELHSDDELLQRRRPPAAGRPEHGDPAEPEGLAAAGGGGLDANMVAMVTDSCWATNQASPDDSLRYDLIINGCPNPADDTVQMQGNGQGTSSVFSFNMFEFSGGSSEIYLHCKLELCPTQGQACTPSCGGGARRRRRSARFAEGNAALITMAWTH